MPNRNKPTDSNERAISQHKRHTLSLFWRLFLSLLLMLLLTSTISVMMERWMNTRALNERMQAQVAHLVTVRHDVIAAIEAGDNRGIRQLFRRERGLSEQIIITKNQGADGQGERVFLTPPARPNRQKNESRRQHNSNDDDNGNPPRPPRADNLNALSPPNTSTRLPPAQPDAAMSDNTQALDLAPPDMVAAPIVNQIITDTQSFPELVDVTATAPDGDIYTIKIQPRLNLQDLMALQRTHLPLRIAIILLFSILACYWLSRTLSRRIRRVQQVVHRLSDGDYSVASASDTLTQIGHDELGALAQDVARLASRLADSEMARKQMLSDISHELRSPLARLDIATEMTRDCIDSMAVDAVNTLGAIEPAPGGTATKASGHLDRIQKESTRMNQLIAQIIHIQSLQMQRYQTSPNDWQQVDVLALLTEIGQDVRFEFQDSLIRWQPPNLPKDVSLPLQVQGDKEQLRSAFENIIRNAFIHSVSCSASDQNEGVVSADIAIIFDKNATQHHVSQLSTSQPSTPALHIRIRDTGGGIAESNLDRIFEPFVRLDASRKRLPTSLNASHDPSGRGKSSQVVNQGGYGLGLAIAHAVISAHRGHITAYNRQDGIKGLVIEIVLPMG